MLLAGGAISCAVVICSDLRRFDAPALKTRGVLACKPGLALLHRGRDRAPIETLRKVLQAERLMSQNS